MFWNAIAFQPLSIRKVKELVFQSMLISSNLPCSTCALLCWQRVSQLASNWKAGAHKYLVSLRRIRHLAISSCGRTTSKRYKQHTCYCLFAHLRNACAFNTSWNTQKFKCPDKVLGTECENAFNTGHRSLNNARFRTVARELKRCLIFVKFYEFPE